MCDSYQIIDELPTVCVRVLKSSGP